ncbi:hypothetical protein PYCCODRAFT_1377920 [Trametes coccinea BRFM310]|uniref:Uncharacterized protein n=1 Tax=Trametes coccinea (strain BRFM310) TaxID=1353009 RepID=A0A1Y2I8P7_TRAC3|nr:hypothetical protein PYCCODRAFT_1377920 [Trametes coccinea BRFM310]
MTYMQKVHWTRAEIRKIMDLQLQQVTRKDELRMKWSTYWRDIVYEHAVAVEGWPDDIPFENLSSATSSLARLELLCVKWMVGTTRFRSVPLEELDLMGLAGKFDRTKPVRPPRADDGLIRGRRRDPEKRSKRLRPYYIKSRLVCHSES